MKNQKAFTLVELLVVISIIAMLVSILLPALGKAKDQARDVMDKSNLRQWGLVFQMYTDDHDGYFQAGYGGTTMQSNWWMKSAVTYYGEVEDIRYCPTATETEFDTDGSAQGPGYGRQPFMAWGHVGEWAVNEGSLDQYLDHGSYGINGWLEDTRIQHDPEQTAKFWRNRDAITGADTVPTLTDAQWLDGWPEPDHAPPNREDSKWQYQANSHMVRFVQNRHNGHQNMLFADGSANSVRLREMWTLKWHQEYKRSGWSGAWPEWMAGF